MISGFFLRFFSLSVSFLLLPEKNKPLLLCIDVFFFILCIFDFVVYSFEKVTHYIYI
jgi:hypothetical protein